MKFCVSSEELIDLEAAVAASKGGARLPALVSLAWQLRHRDCSQALDLLEQAQRMLAGAEAAYPATSYLRARMALVRSDVEAFLSQVDSAEHWLDQARAILPCAEDTTLEGDAFLVESSIARAHSDYGRECQSCSDAIECFESQGNTPRAHLAKAMLTLLRAASASEDVLQARAETCADPAVDAYLCATHALQLFRHEPAQAADLFLEAADLASSMGQVRLAVMSHLNAGGLLQDLADFDGAAECFEAAEQVAKRSGAPVLMATCRSCIGGLLCDLGHLAASRSALESALRSFSLGPPCVNVANVYRQLARTLDAMGLKQQANEAIAKAIEIHRDGRHVDNLTLYLIAQARILAAADEPGEAIAALAEAQALIQEHGLDILMLSVNEALAEIHRLHSMPAPAAMTEPTAVIHYAERALQCGLAIEGWKASASLYSLLADAWSEAGGLERAYAYARKALEAKELELTLRPNNPQALLRLLLQTDDATAPGPLPEQESAVEDPPIAKLLTPKELEVVRLLAKNQSNKEIALVLGISGETVKSHLRSIYAKLDAGSRRHAVVQAKNAGLVG